MQARLRTLLKNIGYEFNRNELFDAALTHRSVGAKNNERLEFLGDGVLNFIVAAELFHRRPGYSEGQLSRLRASLVKGVTLAEIARELELGDCLQLGPGERKSGGFTRDSILADAVEAIVGAVYLDGGFAAAEQVVKGLYQQRLDNLPDSALQKDPKSQLQETLQGRGVGLPSYDLVATRGESHKPEFTVSCRVDSLQLKVVANGSSRRRAEQAAAAKLLNAYQAALVAGKRKK